MSLNQVRVLSAGAGLLSIYALDRSKSEPKSKSKTEGSVFQTKQVVLDQEKVQFCKLENVSNRLNLVQCSNSNKESFEVKKIIFKNK